MKKSSLLHFKIEVGTEKKQQVIKGEIHGSKISFFDKEINNLSDKKAKSKHEKVCN